MDASMAWAVGHNMKVVKQDAADAWATVSNYKAAIKQWEEAVAQRDMRIMELESALAGVRAQRDALKQAHPNSPLLQPTNIRYEDPSMGGAFKNQLTLIWENAYDQQASRYGLNGRKLRIG